VCANFPAVDVALPAIPHPAEQRKHGYVLTGYLAFCLARGALELAAAWAVMNAGAAAPVPARTLALLGASNVAGSVAVWRWSWPGAAFLGAAAVGALVVASSGGLSLSALVAGLMLAGALVVAAAVPWRLRCLRCRGAVARADAQCPTCGQPFA
jgi:hypothetical protein